MAQVQTQVFKVTKGMNLDVEEQSNQPSTAFELYNLKNQVIGGKALNALTNEKGTEKPTLVVSNILNTLIQESVEGTVIGVVPCGPDTAAVFVKQIVKGVATTTTTSIDDINDTSKKSSSSSSDSSSSDGGAKPSSGSHWSFDDDEDEDETTKVVTYVTYQFIGFDDNVLSEYISTDSTINYPTPPEVSGYNFSNWKQVTDETTLKAYKAIYTEIEKTPTSVVRVVFLVDGNVYNSFTIATKDTEYSLIDEPVRDGYTFSGWELRSSTDTTITYSGTFTLNTLKARLLSSSTTSRATKQLGEYTAYFIISESNIIEKYSKPGETVEFPSADSTLNGQVFKGWANVTTNETTQAINFTMPSADITFKVVYEDPTYRVAFYDYDYSLILESQYNNEETILTPANPTRDGYIFAGWMPPVPSKVDEQNYTFVATYFIDDNAVFSEDTEIDYIYRLDYKDDDSPLKMTLLAKGDFQFGNYIDGLFVEENSTLQKVYWVDGKNQLRYINIVNTDMLISDDNYLNTNPRFKLNHHISVEKLTGGGTFTAGVIQYAFTYYIENGPETGIVDMTPLYYISENTRGIAADETVGCSFKISILNPDTFFDYIRVYSITRTTLNGTPVVRIVKDIKI